MIKHSNIIYMPNISALGGIETYVYEMVKKYRYLDIAVVSKQCDENQAKRIQKYCPLYIHTNEQIICDVCIINYDQSIIPFINKEARIYQTIHADYTQSIYTNKPKPNERITGYIAITKFLEEKMSYLGNMIMSYNPLTVENKEFLTLVSATRLHEHKGSNRMLELARALDRRGIDFIWIILTNDKDKIKHKNIVYIPPRLDIYKWLKMADYVVLLSDSEACSYTLNEALYNNIPIITTPLPYLEEIGVKDGINSYIVEFNCSNIDNVAERMKNIPKFEFKKLEDIYNKLLTKKKSKYEEEIMIEVEALDTYQLNGISDAGLGYIPRTGERFKVSKERLDVLLGKNVYNKPFVKVIEEEKAVKPKAKEEKALLPKKSKKK